MNQKIREVYEIYGQIKDEESKKGSGQVIEAIGDNTVDNLMCDLKRSSEVEIDMFVCALLNSNQDNFGFAYVVPQYDGFQDSFQKVVQRYRVMDGMEQGDLFEKVSGMFKDIFMSKCAAMGPKVAEQVGKKYAEQMIGMLKRESIQANVDMDVDKSDNIY